MNRTRQLLDQRRSQQAAKANQAAMAEANKHVSLLELGCELSESEPEKI
jgi:hypothetical protein